jgi:hypothetical protein
MPHTKQDIYSTYISTQKVEVASGWSVLLDLYQKVLVVVITLTKISELGRREKKEKKILNLRKSVWCLSHYVAVELEAEKAQRTNI